MGIGALRAPEFWEWGHTISRAFPITEGTHLEFRGSIQCHQLRAPGGGTFSTITSDQSTTGSAPPTGAGGRVVRFSAS